jgi:hypothetical protein
MNMVIILVIFNRLTCFRTRPFANRFCFRHQEIGEEYSVETLRKVSFDPKDLRGFNAVGAFPPCYLMIETECF